MNKKKIGIAIVAFTFLFVQAIFAHDATCADKFKTMVQTLKLDDTQQTKIKAIKDKLKDDLKSNWDKMSDLREQINQQIQADNIDSAKLDELINTKVQLIATVIKAKIMAKHEIYTLLNAQQKTQYLTMQKKWQEEMVKKYEKCHDDDND